MAALPGRRHARFTLRSASRHSHTHYMPASLPYHFVKRASLIGGFIASLSVLVYDVVRRRRAGQNWNEALSLGSKLLTGNVWIDGALFVAVLAVLAALVCFAMIHPWG